MLKKKDLGRTAGPRMLSLSSKIQMARLKVKSCYSVKNWKKFQLGKNGQNFPCLSFKFKNNFGFLQNDSFCWVFFLTGLRYPLSKLGKISFFLEDKIGWNLVWNLFSYRAVIKRIKKNGKAGKSA